MFQRCRRQRGGLVTPKIWRFYLLDEWNYDRRARRRGRRTNIFYEASSNRFYSLMGKVKRVHQL